MKWIGRFSGYSTDSFRKDLVSGCIVGIVAIPLGMAFAIASGVKPEYGLYTTIIAGILISLLGGSKFQIGGPTGAFIPILLAIVMQYGYENLLIAGFLAGVFLVLMGLLRLGSLIKFIPKPVTIGFTSGIAVIIFSGQIANFLGLEGVERHEYFFYNMKEIFLQISTLNLYSVLIAGICLAALILTPKYLPKVPGSLVGIIVSTLVATWLFPDKVTTIGSAYGAIPAGLPSFTPLDLSWERIITMLQPALIIAMLGSIESLLSAVVADEMTGSRHNSNRELIGQGVANIAAPLFGGIPATGAIARTATNIKNGAASPMSGVIHGIVVLLIVVLFAPYASSIPLASMAPILMVVAWNMSEYKTFTHMLKTRTGDSLILLVTFLLTVFTTLTVAVQAGLALAIILFLKRMSGMLAVDKVLPDHSSDKEKVQAHRVTEERDCPQLGIYTVEGTLFFGASHVLENLGQKLLADQDLRVVLLRMGRVPFMDTTGESNFISLVERLMQRGVIVVISGLRSQPKELLVKTGSYAMIGKDRFFEHTGEALNYALENLQFNKCLGCKQFAFRECTGLSSTGSLRQHIS
ncbi:SulP family inorganic anion transporter [Paenibacillus bouchesdurhonensis]|uniref:SulP family inorganic anion transporter n=1 Tax=Paenibacillus bouchesdurhonensis TaxID=1870990 RepID=UPI000DA607BB|nr:sulfate permease [Paenibacillus bouchesdurhonensis]